jgi:hypothetical protein
MIKDNHLKKYILVFPTFWKPILCKFDNSFELEKFIYINIYIEKVLGFSLQPSVSLLLLD